MTDSFTEAPLSVNFKPGTGYDAPQLTIRGGDPIQLKQRVEGSADSGLFEAISTAANQFKAAYGTPSGAAQTAQTVLGAQPVAAPAPADQWAAPAPQWGQPAAAPAAPVAPVYQPAPAQAQPAAASAGAPFIPAFGMAATFRSGNGAKGPWSAYLDPRPKQVTDGLPADHTGKVPSTDNVDHPGLAQGTHKFAKFLR